MQYGEQVPCAVLAAFQFPSFFLFLSFALVPRQKLLCKEVENTKRTAGWDVDVGGLHTHGNDDTRETRHYMRFILAHLRIENRPNG